MQFFRIIISLVLFSFSFFEISAYANSLDFEKTLTENKNKLYEFNGFIEANQIMDGNSNVVVTDGFTGNVALKTAEGTANFITSELKKTMSNSILGKISALLNIKNLKKRISMGASGTLHQSYQRN